MASKVGKLSDDAKKEAKACSEALRTLRFRPFGNYEICDDTDSLVEISTSFFKAFAPLIKVLNLQIIAPYVADIESAAVFNERNPN